MAVTDCHRQEADTMHMPANNRGPDVEDSKHASQNKRIARQVTGKLRH